MDRALVVVDDTDRHRELLHEAGELAAGVGAELVLMNMITREELESDADALEAISSIEGTGFGDEEVLEEAAGFARKIARDVLEDVDVEYRSYGVLSEDDRRAQTIIEKAEEHDCDHIFITGQRRSPAGKAIFGDTAQRIILNFDDPVTVLTG